MSETKYNPLDEQTVQDAQWLQDNYDYCFCVSSKKGSPEAVNVVAGDICLAMENIGKIVSIVAEKEEENGKKNVGLMLLTLIIAGLVNGLPDHTLFDFRNVVNTDGKETANDDKEGGEK